MSHTNSWFVIVNPKAGNGNAKTKWLVIESLLTKHLFHFKVAFTTHKGNGTSLVIGAVNNGFTKVICVGGDGTLHDIVNGLMLQKTVESSTVSVGLIPIGTGNDWAKTYNIPKNIEDAILLIKKNTIKSQDIGKIDFLDSKKQSVYFNNLAGIGFDGLVAKITEKLKHLGKLSYLIAACQSLISFKNFNVELVYKDNRVTTKSLMILVGLCTYSGGGMRLTDTPDPNDGLFDVTNVTNFNTWDFITNLPKLYNGKVNTAKKVKTFKVTDILILTNKRITGFYLQADGEVIAAENIAISIINKAFSFYS